MADGNFTAESAAQHQAELNDYLQSKNINQLFIQIVESLLIEKPENPIGFIVEFLQKKYPETAGIAPAPPPKKEEEEEEEEDDNDANNGEFKMKTYNRSAKREGVKGESEGQISLEEIQDVPKSDADKTRIEEILKHTTIFKHLAPDQRDLVSRAMSVVEHPEGHVIIQQGDDGDFFYALDTGDVQCYVSPDGKKKGALVKSYASGETFGELAMMYNATRAATCIASTPVRLFALDRKAFKFVLTKSSMEKRAKTQNFLSSVEAFKELNEYELFTISDAMVEQNFADGDVICRQGDQGDDFYIIAKGSVTITQLDAAGEPVEVAKLGVNDYFGEIALLTTKPRQATVAVAQGAGPLKLLSVDRGTFKRLLGPIEDILRRNLDSYNKFRSQHI